MYHAVDGYLVDGQHDIGCQFAVRPGQHFSHRIANPEQRIHREFQLTDLLANRPPAHHRNILPAPPFRGELWRVAVKPSKVRKLRRLGVMWKAGEEGASNRLASRTPE